jgi:hypothetical protein
MALSDREQHILNEIERGLRPARSEAAPLPAAVRTLLAVVISLVAVVIVVALVRSEAAGLTLLVGFGLLGVIGYLHRYNLRHPA